MAPVQFFFDIVCPYAYLASLHIERIAEAAGEVVEYRPILLGGLLKEQGVAPSPMDSMPQAKRDHVHRDIQMSADLVSAPLNRPAEHPRRTLAAMRVLSVCPPALVPKLMAALFDAYWVSGVDISDVRVLSGLASPFGLDVPAILADSRVKQELRARTSEAGAQGVFGVPTVLLDGKLHWGFDRILALGAELGAPMECTGRIPAEVTWYHDVASPFSYLSEARVRAWECSGAVIRRVPILLGGLFRAIGTADVPLHTYSPARQEWTRSQLHEQAKNLGIPFRFPDAFPIRTVLAGRVLHAVPEATSAVYAAVWQDGRDVGDPAVLASVLDAEGLSGHDVISEASRPSAKLALRQATEDARRGGVFGVPTFVAGGHPPIWGQDRMHFVEWQAGNETMCRAASS